MFELFWTSTVIDQKAWTFQKSYRELRKPQNILVDDQIKGSLVWSVTALGLQTIYFIRFKGAPFIKSILLQQRKNLVD